MHAGPVIDEDITELPWRAGAPPATGDPGSYEPRAPGLTPDGRTCGLPWLLANHDFIVQPKP